MVKRDLVLFVAVVARVDAQIIVAAQVHIVVRRAFALIDVDVEIVIGRLLTDEAFRARFLAGPEATLQDLVDRGLELGRCEIAALVSTDRTLWAVAADTLDPRLQKIAVALPAADE